MKKNLTHICFIVPGYPTESKPFQFTFIDQLVTEIADKGIKCTVINPRGAQFKNPPKHWTKKTKKGNKIDIYCPRYPYFYAKKIGRINTGLITMRFYQYIVGKTLDKYQINPDCLYAHFIFPAGFSAAKIGEKLNLPVFFAYGESSPWGIEIIGKNRLVRNLRDIHGVIAVSSAKKDEILNYEIVTRNQVKVFPNAIDPTVFYPRDKETMRKKYDLPLDSFIVGYTGRFNQSKGVMRLVEALKDNQEVKIVLIGGGELEPKGDNIIYQGQVPHNEVPLLLSTCDAFVLPTLNEGCSNAIVEAMACGLPIVSSNKDFNSDILTKGNSILVDPNSVKEIESAILKLKNNPKLSFNLGQKSLEVIKSLTLQERANNIIDWMEDRVFNR